MTNKGCTAFCQQPCEYRDKHHPVLLALIQSTSRAEFIKFKEEVNTLESSTSWRRDDPIPDSCPEFNYPIVHWAAVMGKIRVLEWCIDEKVNLLCKCGNRSETALHRLVMCGLTALAENPGNVYQLFEDIVDLLEILLDQPDDNHDLPLHVATKLVAEQHGKINQSCFDIYSKLVEILAQKTCQMHDDLLDSCNMDGNTPLHILAASDNSLKLVKTLLEYGADMEIKNMEGDTPFDIAKTNGARKITKLLLKFAKSNRNCMDSSFFDESDEDSVYEDSQVLGRVDISDGDSDIIHHDSDNDDDEYLNNLANGGSEALKKFDWPSNRNQSDFAQSCGPVSDVTHLKRKSANSEVGLPIKKKPNERGLTYFSKPLCPTVAISPIQIASLPNNTSLVSPTAGEMCTSNVDKKSVSSDMNNNSDKQNLNTSIKKENKSPGNGWSMANDTGEDTQRAAEKECNNQNEIHKRLTEISGENSTSAKSKKCIEDVVKNIKERQESVETGQSNSAQEMCEFQSNVDDLLSTRQGGCEDLVANIPQQLHNGKVHNTSDNKDTACSLEDIPEIAEMNSGNYETLPEVRVKIEKDMATSTSAPSGRSPLDPFDSLVNVFSQDDLTELLQKTRTKTLKKIEKLDRELEEATRNERVEDQEYTLIQQRIQTQQEYIKRLQEEVQEWTKESDMYLKRKDLATKKKITCETDILAEKEKLQTIKKHLNSCT